MTTTEQIKAPIIQAKPTYSVVLYDPASLEPFSDTKDDGIAIKQARLRKPQTKKSLAEKFRIKQEEFQEALLEIFRHGLQYNEAIVEIHATIAVPVTNAAIPGLAKILATYRAFFENAETAERDKLFKILVQQCKTNFGKSAIIKSDKRTTEWHLLSRMFRQSDRRQASADAKILKFAHAEGVTEESFASWVERHGTLSKILRQAPSELEESPKRTTKRKPVLRWIAAAQVPDTDAEEALAALKRLADGKRYNIVIHHHNGRFEIMREEVSNSEGENAAEQEPNVIDVNCKANIAPEQVNDLEQVSLDPAPQRLI